jgi:methanethiol oxidase
VGSLRAKLPPMALLRPDPTFYPSPRLAMQAPPERLAYVAALNPPGGTLNDAMLVIDVDPASASYGKRVGQTVLPNAGDELHHFGWNACSSALCPYAPHPHIERRYLVVPGLRSSRIHILDIKPDPRNPSIVKVIEPEEISTRTGYSRPHTVHCGPEGVYVSAFALRTGMDLLAFSFWITSPLRFWENGRWTAARNIWVMTFGGISLKTLCLPVNGAPRARSRTALYPRTYCKAVRPSDARLGSAQEASCPGA